MLQSDGFTDVFAIADELAKHEIDYAKRVIDELAPGGGFIFTTDKIWNSPTDICPNLFEVYEFAHAYSKH